MHFFLNFCVFFFTGFWLIFGAEGKIAKISQPAKIRTAIVLTVHYFVLYDILFFIILYIYIYIYIYIKKIVSNIYMKKKFEKKKKCRNLRIFVGCETAAPSFCFAHNFFI